MGRQRQHVPQCLCRGPSLAGIVTDEQPSVCQQDGITIKGQSRWITIDCSLHKPWQHRG
jgi:hypothetical protein